MRVGLFYPWNVFGGWGSCGGYSATLTRMGHEVVEHAFPGNFVNVHPKIIEEQVKKAPTFEKLNSCDVVLSLHHEYTQTWLARVYNYDEVWKKIKPPIVARLDESLDRFDLGLMSRLEEMKLWCSAIAYPAAQDADKQNAPWVPHAVDASMFSPFTDGVTIESDGAPVKKYDVAFIGSLYQERHLYLKYLSSVLPSDKVATINVGQVAAQDLSGMRGDVTMQMLAENYRQIKIFFCLPPRSRLVVAKVFEVMACGTFVMYPRFPGEARKNDSLFEDGKEIVYYDIGQFVDNARQIIDWLYDDKKRAKVAAAGCKKVRFDCTYEKMFETLFQLAVAVRDTGPRLVRAGAR